MRAPFALHCIAQRLSMRFLGEGPRHCTELHRTVFVFLLCNILVTESPFWPSPNRHFGRRRIAVLAASESPFLVIATSDPASVPEKVPRRYISGIRLVSPEHSTFLNWNISHRCLYFMLWPPPNRRFSPFFDHVTPPNRRF